MCKSLFPFLKVPAPLRMVAFKCREVANEKEVCMLSGWSDGTILARCSCFATHGAVGDQGYGSMDRRYVDAYMYDAWLMRNARYGLARHTWDKYHAASTPVQRRAILLQDNPRWRGTIRYAGMNYQIFIYETLSINDERPAEIIELSNRDGIRVGWCETFYGSGTSAIIKELFVWPPFRRRGYGTILEAAAVIRTQGWVDELVLWFYEPTRSLGVERTVVCLRLAEATNGHGAKAAGLHPPEPQLRESTLPKQRGPCGPGKPIRCLYP